MATTWCWRVVAAVVLTMPVGARGGESRLLVSVEVAPGVGVAAADVRRAVATELGTAVIAARESSADGATDVLLVALDPREIRMSLRVGSAPIVSRAIAAPADRTERLRSIGWLAGNLVRDQVGPIVATAEASPPVPAPVAIEPSPLPASAPASVSAGAPVSPAPAAPPPAAVVASAPAPAPIAISGRVWSITVIGGPVATVVHDSRVPGTSVMSSGAFQLELQRQPSPERMLLGLALTAGPDSPRHYLGLAAFAGEAWGGRSWFAEATLGLGLEALDAMVRIGMSSGPAYMAPTVSEEGWASGGVVPGLYVRAAATGGLRLSRFFDLVAQLGAHLSSNGTIGSYLSSAAGVRLPLP